MISLSCLQKFDSRKAVERFIVSEYNSKTMPFLRDLDKAVNELLGKDLKLAGDYVKSLDRVFRLLPPKYMPRLHAIRGRYNHRKGNPNKAIKSYRQAANLYREMGDFENVAKTRKGLLDVYMYLGKYPEAIKEGKKALSYFRRKNQLLDAGEVMANMGNIYHRKDNNRIALDYYNKARKIFLKKGGFHMALIEFNRANIYMNTNNLKKAEDLYRISGEFYHKAGLDIPEAQAKYSIAYLYFLQDRFTEAIKMFEEVYETFKALGAEKEATVTLLDRAEIDIQLNQFSSAADIADSIIPKFEKLGMHYEQSKACYFSADARIMLGDTQSAARMLSRAKKHCEKEGNDLWLGMVNIARGKLNIALEKYAEASRAASEAISLFDKSGDRRRKIDAELVLMRAATLSGKTSRAFKISDSLESRKLVSYQSYNLNYLMGYCYYHLGNYATALEKFRAAVAIVEKMLMGLYPDEIRFFFAIDKYECYRMVVECLLRLKRVDASFMANLHALRTINHKTHYALRKRAAVPHDLIEKRASLRAALKKLNQVGAGEQREIASQASYSSIEQKLWTNERKIRALLYPRDMEKKGGRADFRNLPKMIGPDELVINFFSSREGIGAFLADPGNVRFIQFNTDSKELDYYLKKLHFVSDSTVFGMKNDDSGRIAESYLDHIYGILFRNLESEIAGKKLIFIVDGNFAQIPFNALRDEHGNLLTDKHEIRIIINPDDLRQRHALTRNFKDMRNAIFAVSSQYLPLINLEAEQIKRTFPASHIYLNEAAASSNLLSEIRRADGFIHIAAHAARSSDNPLFSRILLGDGPFFPFDLFESGIRARIVILSGCQTAAPGLYYGDSFSLAKAFFQAGATYVLATLWPVTDKISMLFMNRFYKSLCKHNDVHHSFLDAVNEIKDICENPAYWSSFILLGI